MDPWEIAIYTGVIVVAGNITKGPTLKESATGAIPKKPSSMALLSAAVFYALFLVGLEAIDKKLSQAFAYLILIAAVLQYAVPIVTALGN